MKMNRQVMTTLGSVVLAALGMSCADRPTEPLPLADSFSEQFCAVQATCNCDAPPISDCRNRVQRLAAGWERDALAAGLSFDEACLEDLLDNLDAAAQCGQLAVLPDCPVYSGLGAEGDPCGDYGAYPSLVTDCRAGLTCSDEGVCEDRRNPPILQLGDVCSVSATGGFPVGVFGSCAESLACDTTDTLRCVPSKATIPNGEACTGGPQLCQSRFCRVADPSVPPSPEAPGVCQPRTALPGEPCTQLNECTTGCELDIGTCFVIPPSLCSMVKGVESRLESAASDDR